MAKKDDTLTYVIIAAVVYFAHKEGIINLNSIMNDLKNLFKPGGTTTPPATTPPATCPAGQTKDAAGVCQPNEEEEEGGEEEEEDEDANLARVRLSHTLLDDLLYHDTISVR